MSEQLEPNFIEYEAISVLYRNNGDLKQRTSKHTNAKIIIESAYLSVWHKRPLWPKASLLSDLVDSFERCSITPSGISGHGTSGLAAYNMSPADFIRHGATLLGSSTVTGMRLPWYKVWQR
jgi:hypothetical protein